MTNASDRIEIRRSVVSVSRFHNRSSLDSLVKHLRSIRARGKLTVNLSDGGISAIQFEATYLLNGHDNIEILFESPKK
jgi:hypothetical protein